MTLLLAPRNSSGHLFKSIIKLQCRRINTAIRVMEMAKYIWSIMKTAPAILMSWGLEKVAPYRWNEMEGLWFHVSGFKHQGWVVVLYNEGMDLFEVKLLDDSGTEKAHVEMVYFDNLIECIDELVERTVHYEADVKKWLNTPEQNSDKQLVKDIACFTSKLNKEGTPVEIVIVE